MIDRPDQAAVRDLHCAAGACLADGGERGSHIVRRQLGQAPTAYEVQNRAGDLTVGRDRLGRPSWQPVLDPVVYGRLECVTSSRPDTLPQVVVQLAQLADDLFLALT
jgi:hypothetical protein